MKVTLYGYWRSSCTWRVRIALHHKQIPFEYRPVHLLKHEHHSDVYRDMNPSEQVPTLEVEDRGETMRLGQSLAIIQLAEALWHERPLLPADPWSLGRAWQMAEIVNSGIQPLQNLSVTGRLKEAGLDERAWAAGFIARGLTALEVMAARHAGRHLVGDTVTVADCCLVPQLYHARRFGVDLAPFPTLLRIEAVCAALPAFEKAHAEKQIDAQL